MTIALRIELKEDWGQNMPAVRVMGRPVRHARLGHTENDSDHLVARLTPAEPVADVTITKDRDLYFCVERATDERMTRE